MSVTLSHSGLPAGIKRSQFIESIAPALKARGLKTSAIVYLSKAFDNWTRDQDFEPNRICGFWHQVSSLAEKLSCTVRTVHSIEYDLENARLVSRNPKANGRRDGMREQEGRNVLRKLFGINLAPIIEQASDLLAEAETIRMHQDAMDMCRSEIRHINKSIRRLNNTDALEQARSILPEGRSATVRELAKLEEIRDALLAVENSFKIDVRSEEFSDRTEENDVPIIQTKQTKFLYEAEAVSEQVTIQQAISLAAEPFRDCLDMYGDYTWRGITNAAYEIARSIGIDDRTWGIACDNAVLGPERAALCILLIHRNMCLPPSSSHYPRNPSACFGGMIKAAKSGEFSLSDFIAAVRGYGKRRSPQHPVRGFDYGR